MPTTTGIQGQKPTRKRDAQTDEQEAARQYAYCNAFSLHNACILSDM